MPETNTPVNEKKQVQQVIEAMFAALSQKDVKSMMTHYAPDVTVFDCKPPFQTKGAVAWRHIWEACLPYFPDTFTIEMRDLVVHASGTVAVAHYLFRLTGPDQEHATAQTWMRGTTVLRWQQGRWKIVHEHGSLPYNPHTLQAVFSLEP